MTFSAKYVPKRRYAMDPALSLPSRDIGEQMINRQNSSNVLILKLARMFSVGRDMKAQLVESVQKIMEELQIDASNASRRLEAGLFSLLDS